MGINKSNLNSNLNGNGGVNGANSEEGGYDQQSISSLKDEETVRARPSVIFGTNDEYGAAQSVYEIIANAIDEYREGYGKQIKISLYNDGKVEVADGGRGVPMGWNEAEQKFNWELVFCTLYASGKYDSSNYEVSLGLNGLGATAAQYASEFMEVYSTRGGETSIMKFEKGKPVGDLKVIETPDKGDGTIIRFKPDPEVFINIRKNTLPPEHYINLLRKQAMLHDGLEVVLYHETIGKDITLKYDKGLTDFIDAVIQRPMLKNTLMFSGEDEGVDDEEMDPTPYKVTMRLAINFSRKTELMEIYHNSSHLYDGGVTADALRLGVTKAFDEYARDTGKLNKYERFSYRDIESIMIAIGDTNAPGNRTFFKHQTKSAITNPFIKRAYNEFVYHNLKNWLNNDDQSDKVMAEVLANKTAREEADKVSKRVVQSLRKDIGVLGNRPDKFIDCRSKKINDRELYIVEGDSALGSCKLSRDAEFQAITAVRGKILNCLKEDLTRILNNDIILNLLRILGCGIEIESKYIKGLPKFDMSKLRWGKVIICTDADLDGQQIRCLILTMIYRLMPSLLKAGKVFIAETPLFEINHKNDTYFAYDIDERDDIISQLELKGVKESQIRIQRSKGLGENNPDMMHVSTMAPKTRRLIPVEYSGNDISVKELFNALLGDDIETRRLIVNEYFEQTEVGV